MVEQNKSSTYYEIVYAPTGAKLAILNGATLQRAFVPLTGGSQAVYTSSGLATIDTRIGWVARALPPRQVAQCTLTRPMDPSGEPYAQSGTADLSFTGMNQDTAPNMYDFPARETGTQGRWPSPDPLGNRICSFSEPPELEPLCVLAKQSHRHDRPNRTSLPERRGLLHGYAQVMLPPTSTSTEGLMDMGDTIGYQESEIQFAQWMSNNFSALLALPGN